jgi:hypothetical protein
MTWRTGRNCAAALLLAAAVGCTTLDSFGLQMSALSGSSALPSGDTHYVVGSLESVVLLSQGTLEALGVQASAAGSAAGGAQGTLDVQARATPRKEEVRLKCTTRNGSHFVLVFDRRDANGAEYTEVHAEWDGSPNDPAALEILARLDAVGKR